MKKLSCHLSNSKANFIQGIIYNNIGIAATGFYSMGESGLNSECHKEECEFITQEQSVWEGWEVDGKLLRTPGVREILPKLTDQDSYSRQAKWSDHIRGMMEDKRTQTDIEGDPISRVGNFG